MNGTSDWSLCGLRVRSETPLPEALPWSDPAESEVDVTIRVGEVPEELLDAEHTERVAMIARDGTYLFQLPRVGRYLVRSGCEIVVQPTGAAGEPDVRTFIYTNCLSALVLQRGLIPLHGAVAKVFGHTVAIVGHPGEGKSTLAATLAMRGHSFLAEDVCVLDPSDDGSLPAVIPTHPNIRLWESALDNLDIDASTLVRSRRNMRKYHLFRPNWFHDRPERLSAVIRIQEARETVASEGMARMKGSEQLDAIAEQLLRPKLAEILGLEGRTLALAMRLAQEKRVFNLGIVRNGARLDVPAAAIEALCSEL